MKELGICLVFLYAVVCEAVLDEHGLDVKEAHESGHSYVTLKEPTVYDAYFAKPVTKRRATFLEKVTNGTSLCTVLVNPCRKDEGRRVDGTCVNPKYPSRGATISPYLRMLPPMYGPGSTLRPAKDGSELPSTRLIRTTLLADGFITNHEFSNLAANVLVFSAADHNDLAYLFRYVVASDCCLGNMPNEVNPFCIPIKVAEDDPYLQGTGIRCLNMTRVEYYQDFGCVPRTLPAARYSRVTPLLDLSLIYGNTDRRNMEIRTREAGLLAFRMEGNREVPLLQSSICLRNQPQETSCYGFGDELQANSLTGILLTSMWFFREHNRLARKLAALNPCWDDEKLFQTARQINIAQWQYIFYYELIAEILGHKNAIAEGLIYEGYGYVNDFDPHYKPGTFREYSVGTRWFHTFQPAFHELYRDHKYVGYRRQVEDEYRSGILANNNTEAELNEGSLFQPAAKLDKVIEPDLAERIYGTLQRASDLPAIDMMRGRDSGFAPYNYYRKLCGLKVAHHFEDFEDTIDKDRVEKLRLLYDDDVDEVELIVAIYSEKLLPNAWVGPTLYCIMVQNLLQWRKSDQFFFEHGDIPAALTLDQLHEVKKTSIARVACDNAVDIKKIQPKAFYRSNEWNQFVSCNEIPGMDLSQWKDHKCS